MSALVVESLSFSYPDATPVLREVNLSIAQGERVALLGPNGAGKTTLLLHLNGVLGSWVGASGGGSVTVASLPVSRRTLAQARRLVGIVFQDPDDQLFMPTVARDVAFGPTNLRLPPAEVERRVAWALAAVGLPDHGDRAPEHLSMGERRRVALAGVLAMSPEVLVLDEPSANLDPRARREFAEVLDGLDTTVLMATHDLPYALQLCPRAVILDGGRIVADGPTRDILSDEALLTAHRLELPFGFSA